MALVGRKDDLIHVPWLTANEWLRVYKQIYSSDLAEQSQAYETLLVWKTRIPKLPVGIECSLGLLQVCLRDREWTPKICNGEMSVSYENDLRMLYSTVIMKFLNHISNIAHNKQTSLFVIAKQLHIPDWIVDLRHGIAHGHELPSIDVMRVVANILFTWLHEEYWAAEVKNIQDSEDLDDEYCDSEDEDLVDLIELWTAIKLYSKTKYKKVSDLPDTEIKDTLNNLITEVNINDSSNENSISIEDETDLLTISTFLLSQISKSLNKGDFLIKREKIFIDSIINNEAFSANPEILRIFIKNQFHESIKNCLPQPLINFWKDLLLLLQEKKLLLSLFLQLIEQVHKEKNSNKKLLISLWIKSIAQAYNRQKIARHIFQTLEQKFDHEKQKMSHKDVLNAVNNKIDKEYAELKNVICLNVTGDFPKCLTDEKFVKRLVLNFDEFSEHYIPEILNLSSFFESDTNAKEKLLSLMKIHSLSDKKDEKMEVESTNETDKIYTIQDLEKIEKKSEKNSNKTECNKNLGDSQIRNKNWKIASEKCDWSICPIGILPWQLDDVQPVDSLTVPSSFIRYAVVRNLELPKIIDSNKLKLHSKIHWENILKKMKTRRRKKFNVPKINEQEDTMKNVESVNKQSALN